MSFDWNYGESPLFIIKKQLDDYEINIEVSSGLIMSCILLHEGEKMVLTAFNGIRFEQDAFKSILNNLTLDLKAVVSMFINRLFE